MNHPESSRSCRVLSGKVVTLGIPRTSSILSRLRGKDKNEKRSGGKKRRAGRVPRLPDVCPEQPDSPRICIFGVEFRMDREGWVIMNTSHLELRFVKSKLESNLDLTKRSFLRKALQRERSTDILPTNVRAGTTALPGADKDDRTSRRGQGRPHFQARTRTTAVPEMRG